MENEFTVHRPEQDVGPEQLAARAKRQQLIEQAIDDRRAQGEPHPVYLVLSVETSSGLDPKDFVGPIEGKFLWIVTRKQALAALKDRGVASELIKRLRDAMQRPKWQPSYWSMIEMGDTIDFSESQLFKDVAG